MKELLKFITCGSVDDGKSTLIGHMLYDAKLIYADQENTLILDSKLGNTENELDYSLILDGLILEREQGITIDVAYRYFSTQKRSFIVADTPGHEEYTRNMAVGASFADLAIILIDATKGMLNQTKRHIRICELMGVRDFIFAVNKMDLVSYEKEKFQQIEKSINDYLKDIKHKTLAVIPVSATKGDNVNKKSDLMSWYTGNSLLQYLEKVEINKENKDKSFIMPVQRVCRPNLNFRGFQGQVIQGDLKVGDEVIILPSEEKANIKQLLITDKKSDIINAGQAVTIVLDKEIDCARGSVIVKEEKNITGRLFRCNLLWMDDENLLVGSNYLLKIATKTIPATIIKIHYCIDVNTGEHILQEKANKNDIINCDIALPEKIVFDSFDECQELGRLILINRITNMTSACGVIEYKLRRSDNLTWQHLDITKEFRANQKNQTPKTFWFTGLSGSGKSTIANAFEKSLVGIGKHTMILDGDNIRMGISNNLGFNHEDRTENIRRIAEVAKLMNDAGIIVLVSAISPFQNDREMAKNIIGDGFYEVYVSTPLEECIKRDTKGLYKKALAGEIPNFTGISSPYEVPINPDIKLETQHNSVLDLALTLLEFI